MRPWIHQGDLVLVLRYRKSVTYGFHVLLGALETHETPTRYDVRFGETVERIRDAMAESRRPAPSWFGLTMWCGLGSDAGRARELLGRRMQALYNQPPERF